jgi:hypothetical protein
MIGVIMARLDLKMHPEKTRILNSIGCGLSIVFLGYAEAEPAVPASHRHLPGFIKVCRVGSNT